MQKNKKRYSDFTKEEKRKYHCEAVKRYNLKNKNKIKQKNKIYRHKWYLKNKDYHKKYLKKNPDEIIKLKCRWEYGNLVKLGKIKRRPCIICGNKKTDGHHEDYTKPKEVIWLCRLHHNQYHLGKLIINKNL